MKACTGTGRRRSRPRRRGARHPTPRGGRARSVTALDLTSARPPRRRRAGPRVRSGGTPGPRPSWPRRTAPGCPCRRCSTAGRSGRAAPRRGSAPRAPPPPASPRGHHEGRERVAGAAVDHAVGAVVGIVTAGAEGEAGAVPSRSSREVMRSATTREGEERVGLASSPCFISSTASSKAPALFPVCSMWCSGHTSLPVAPRSVEASQLRTRCRGRRPGIDSRRSSHRP